MHLRLHPLRLLVDALRGLLQGRLLRDGLEDPLLDLLRLIGRAGDHLVHLGDLLRDDLLLALNLCKLSFRLLQRLLKDAELLLQPVPLCHHLLHLPLQEGRAVADLVEDGGEVFVAILLLLDRLLEGADLSHDRHLLLLHFLQNLLRSLQVLVPPLDGEQRALPLLDQLLLLEADLLHLIIRLSQHPLRCLRLLLLRRKLGGEHLQLVLQHLCALHQVVDQQVLMLLLLLQVRHLLLRLVRRSARDGNLALHLLVVLLHLLKRRVELVQLDLELVHPLRLVCDLRLLLVIVLADCLRLIFRLLPHPPHVVEALVRLLQHDLHPRKLLLHPVQLHTDVLLLPH
mmetsp:Transcript_12015/g.41675  ORF Transcript_12015/g.41675 Transcript_12015/m.41675 type:complete len:342 (-) Transcript_12015:478-1503(-)